MCKIKTSEEKDELNSKLKKLIVLYFAMTTSTDEGLDRPERCAPMEQTNEEGQNIY